MNRNYVNPFADPNRTPEEEQRVLNKLRDMGVTFTFANKPVPDPEKHPDPLFRPSTHSNLEKLFKAYVAGGRSGLEAMHRKLFKK